jgi:SAM-dependent methyltransferase
MKEYTDIIYWEKYWQNLNISSTDTTFFEKLITNFPKNAKLIEIGGFPGNFAAFFIKKMKYDVTILDYFINTDIIHKIETINKLPKNSIKYLNSDFLKIQLPPEYDIVCSFGFIEHFEDTALLIEKHIQILKKGGILLITIPNFLGLNGIVQRIFHRENYEKHNTKCMKIKHLKRILNSFQLTDYKLDYFEKPGIWIEREKVSNKNIQFLISILNVILGLIPFKRNRFFAPYIYILGFK